MSGKSRRRKLDELKGRFPSRENEISKLNALLGEPGLALPLYIHGPSGCGKSALLRGVVEVLELRTAYLDCITHPTPQSIFEAALNQLANHRPQASNGYSNWSSCDDSPAAFIAGLRHLVEVRRKAQLPEQRLCLVFDKAERLAQRRDLLQTLIALPSLFQAAAAGLVASGAAENAMDAGAVLPIFVGESLWPDFQLHCDGAPRVLQFRMAGYSKAGLETVLKRDVHSVCGSEGTSMRSIPRMSSRRSSRMRAWWDPRRRR